MEVIHYVRNLEGGAGIYAQRLHQELVRVGLNSQIVAREFGSSLVNERFSRQDWSSRGFARDLERISNKAFRVLSREGHGPFLPLFTPFSTPLQFRKDFRGIVQFHWIAKWIDLPSAIKSIPKHVPVIISLHDVSSMTGGCCLFNGCELFQKHCSPCPILKSPFNRILAKVELNRKRNAIAGRNAHIIGNSSWTTMQAKKSRALIGAASFNTILPGIPEEFRPIDKKNARDELKIPLDTVVLGFVAAELNDDNKQFDLFQRSLERVSYQLPVLGLVVGNGKIESDTHSSKIRYLGKINSPSRMALIYAAMDLFVFPSKMESFGQVAAEASLCGTPTCAFAVGGVSDIVIHDKTGKLAESGDNENFLRNVEALVSNQQLLRRYGDLAESHSRERFTTTRFGEEHLSVYNHAMACSTRK